MLAKRLTPILNVSNIQQSFAWFEKLGWKKGWDWGSPPTFGGVCSGECEIFLCEDGQGGRGRSALATTHGFDDGDGNGVWMSIFVDDVEAHFNNAKSAGVTIVEDLHETIYGELQYGALDLEGHHWLFSQHARDLSPNAWGAKIAPR